MLQTRLWMGACLVALASLMLVYDQAFEPWFPFLLLFFLVLGFVSARELLLLLPADQRPPFVPCIIAVLAVLVANWPAHVFPSDPPADPWRTVFGTFAAMVLGSFLVEMASFRAPGGSVVRMALAVWVVAYLGVLPSFLAQLRWPPFRGASEALGRAEVAALALAIFVPKCCDVGAYFTGRFLGRRRMTPVLSPQKTWEGFVGGLTAAVLGTIALNHWLPRLGLWPAVGFGLTVGLAGILGDLAESLIKRDCRQKDASHSVPGFGGVLDVLDSIIFAAPVSYWWLQG